MLDLTGYFYIKVTQADDPARNKERSYVAAKDLYLHVGKHVAALAVMASCAKLPLNATITLGERTTIIQSEAGE